MTVEQWLKMATADADARGLPELKALLQTLARSTEQLRRHDAELRRDPRSDATR